MVKAASFAKGPSRSSPHDLDAPSVAALSGSALSPFALLYSALTLDTTSFGTALLDVKLLYTTLLATTTIEAAPVELPTNEVCAADADALARHPDPVPVDNQVVPDDNQAINAAVALHRAILNFLVARINLDIALGLHQQRNSVYLLQRRLEPHLWNVVELDEVNTLVKLIEAMIVFPRAMLRVVLTGGRPNILTRTFNQVLRYLRVRSRLINDKLAALEYGLPTHRTPRPDLSIETKLMLQDEVDALLAMAHQWYLLHRNDTHKDVWDVLERTQMNLHNHYRVNVDPSHDWVRYCRLWSFSEDDILERNLGLLPWL